MRIKKNTFPEQVLIGFISLGIFAMVIGYAISYDNSRNAELKELRAYKAKIKPCKCLTYHQIMTYTAKYDMFMDSLNYSSKKNRERLADSTRKYGQLLRQQD